MLSKPKGQGWSALTQATCRPDDVIALGFSGTQMTYRELEARADAAAVRIAALVASGRDQTTKPLVAISMARGPDAIIAILAILKASCVCVPIDPEHPMTHRLRMVAKAGCALVIADDPMPDATCSVMTLDALKSHNVTAPIQIPGSESDLGFVLFTSGTTGEPKGVLLGLDGLIKATMDFSRRTALSGASVIAQYAGLSFDAAILEFLLAYLNHARLEIIPEDARKAPEVLGDVMADRSVTHIILPAAVVPYVPIRTDYVLQAVICVGDVLDDKVFSAWAQHYPTFNGYGPTEASICASLEKVAPGRPVTLGSALCHVRFDIGGSTGDELLIAGNGLALGYLNDPDQTAERFIKGPDGQVWYHTGDRVERQTDGALRFVGRHDFQTKIRGVRIEVSGLEALLKSLPGVSDATIVVGGADRQAKYLAAFLASDADGTGTIAAARKLIEDGLPASHMPSVFRVLPRLPMTVNQKVDRRALVSLLESTDSSGGSITEQVRACYRGAVHGADSADTENFFHLGGDSIGAMRLLDTVSQIIGRKLPVRAFRENPTLSGLLALIDGDAAPETTIIPNQRATDILPLSHQQNAAWYMFQQDTKSKAYLAEAVHHFDGAFDAAALSQALSKIFAEHEIYRTIFFERDGAPVQQILDTYTPVIHQIDAGHLAVTDEATFIHDVFRDHLPGIFDLGQLPLAHFVLIRFAEDRHVFLHQEHHIVHDGWGGSEFTAELINWYHHYADTEYEHVAIAPAQYADFLLTQRDWLTTPQAQTQREFWQQQLIGAPQSVAIFGKKSLRPGFDGGHCRLDFSRQQWQAAEAAARDFGVTVFGFTTAILNIVLSRYSRQDDIVVGAPFANRNWQNSSNILGMLVNTMVLRNSVDNTQSLAEFMRATQATIDAAYAHQEYPFSAVVEAINPDRFGGQNPLFNVLLGFHDAPIRAHEVDGFRWRKDETVISHTSKFDLDCLVVNREANFTDDDRVSFLWEYRADVYATAEIEQFVASFEQVFVQLCEDRSGKVGDVSAVTSAQADLLTQQWGRGGPARADHLALCEGRDFATNVDLALTRSADAIALETTQTALSYHALDQQSAAIAAAISDRVAPNDRVAIFAERGIAQIVAMVAAIRLRATVVCLDPAQPAARVRRILEDCQPTVVLCDDIDTQVLGGIAQVNIAQAAACIAPTPERGPVSDHIAYVTYTSGSTGQPKGVEVPANGLTDACLHLMNVLDLGPAAVGLSLTYSGFDAYHGEIWPVLLAGGKVVIAQDDERDDLPRLSALMSCHNITCACFPTGLLEQACATNFTWPSSLTVLAAGGDRLGPVRFPDDFKARFFNLYGPTETTIDATWYEVPHNSTDAPAIGRPAFSTNVLVLEGDRPVPPGGPGELVIGGTGVAKGYLNQPDETAKSFVNWPDPTSPRYYRSGDLVRWRSDGQMEYLGRIDDEISLRGYRISPAEINVTLQAHSAVAQSAVAVKGNALFAYVTLHPDEAAGPTNRIARQIKVHLKTVLPKYMRPNAIVVLPRLPLTTQGKVDIAALPSPLEQGTAFEAPATPSEHAMLDIWQAAIPAESISVTQNFFAIGGHSLLAMRMIATIRDRFGVALKITDFFERGTIRDLAEQVDLISGQADMSSFSHEGEF
ncbi:MAG: amino acid adenylation domain-containing protein [Sulfitobacter sp.]